MKLTHAAVLLATAFLAACGGGTPEGDVRFIGFAPVTSKDKDVRGVHTACPACGESMAIDQEGEKGVKNRCENKKCRTKVIWSDNYRCPSCKGSGRCAACTVMEQNGDCYNCRQQDKSQGVLIYAGQSPNCPNCKGSKQCPICKGSQKCDYCEGAGKVPKEVVKARAAKSMGRDELPPSDSEKPAPKPEEKKDAPKPDGEEKK